MARRTLIAGNWKMNGAVSDLRFFEAIGSLDLADQMDVLVCPPFPLIDRAVAATAGNAVKIGAQDCHRAASGAHTGDVSAVLLRELGATHVIVGHSERRADHGETDAMVRAKAEAALAAGMTPIICVGECQAEREAGDADRVVAAQLSGSLPETDAPIVIAYEPVWAIGTGLTASLDDIADMHAKIRRQIPAGSTTQILYGGSVKPGNAAEIIGLEDVDGALIGGASLTAESFSQIIKYTRN